MKNKELEHRCYHEAGHAVTALILGADVQEITSNYVFATFTSEDNAELALNRMIICVSGVIAERIKYKRATRLIYGLDDYIKAAQISREAGIAFKERTIEKQARLILSANWDQVEQISKKLFGNS